MIAALRLIGITNAAIWLGAVVYHLFVVNPTFGSEEMIRLLRSPHAIASSLLVEKRFFLLCITCGFIALFHLIAEWLYLGRSMSRARVGLIGGLLVAGILAGGVIQRQREKNHTIAFVTRDEQRRVNAQKTFQLWSGVQAVIKVVLLGGVAVYFWKTAIPEDKPRFLP